MPKLAPTALWLALGIALPARGVPVIIDAGRGNGIQFYGVGTNVFEREDIYPQWGWQLDRTWTARVMYWNAEHPQPFGKHLWDASFIPTLRLSERRFEAAQPFVEAGIGAHLLSATALDNRSLSTAFQFGEQLAVGIRIPGRVPLTFSVRAEHVSNGRIKQPNSGVTFASFRLGIDWR
jgi:lipid A 3-O-deacylase